MENSLTQASQLPHEVIASILSCLRMSSIVGDTAMDSFILNHCTQIHPNSLFNAFVKKKRICAVVKFFNKYSEKNLSHQTVQDSLCWSLKHKDFAISQVICNKCPLAVHTYKVRNAVVNVCIRQMSKCTSTDLLDKYCTFFVHHLLKDAKELQSTIPKYMLTSLIQCSLADDILSFLASHEVLESHVASLCCCDNIDKDDRNLLHLIIRHGCVNFLYYLITQGYVVTTENLIDGIVYGNMNINRLLLRYI